MRKLIIAPHSDDEVLGAGGTVIRATAEKCDVYVCIVTVGTEPLFSRETVFDLREESKKCHQYMGIKTTYYLDYPAVMLEKIQRYELNKSILQVIREVAPDEVYIPHWGDIQKDHQLVAEAAMVALRPKYGHVVRRIYAYETLSETGWNIPNLLNEFIPNVYVDISEHLAGKLEAIKMYNSQLGDFPAARSAEAIEALARYRGATIGTEAAEAFELVREIF